VIVEGYFPDEKIEVLGWEGLDEAVYEDTIDIGNHSEKRALSRITGAILYGMRLV
jgi:hypothetical protein